MGFGLGSEVNEKKLEALKLEMWDVEEAIDLIERVLEGRDLP